MSPRAMPPMLVAALLSCALYLLPARAAADAPQGGNLMGQRGLLRMVAASNHPAGVITLGADLQYFSAGDLVANGQDHSRLHNTLSFSWTPLRFIEAALAFHVISDSSTGATDELQVAVGDPQISLKGSYEILTGLTVGGLVDLRFPSGAGYFEAALSSTSALLAVVGSYRLSQVPLWFHLNVGFFIDGSKNMFDDLTVLTPSQRYAAQISSFNRVVTRLGVEYVTRYVGPFVELSLEPFVGNNKPSFGASPNRLSLGLRAWPTKQRGLQILAALDVGLTGVGHDALPILAPGDYAVVIPRWNLALRVSYRFDPFAEPAPVKAAAAADPAKACAKPQPQKGYITGLIKDARSGKPVAAAMVRVEGEAASSQTINPQDGSFRTFGVKAGKRTLFVAADGYVGVRREVVVRPGGGTDVELQLKPSQGPLNGTLRGTIKDTAGRTVKGATVLIPTLDKTLEVPKEGQFRLMLKPGEYQIIISAPRYRTQRKSIKIQEGDTVILNVELFR